jgi:alpha-ketoglutarate-dependent taurine dioxygenase
MPPFRRPKRKNVTLSAEGMIRTSFLNDQSESPLVVQPAVDLPEFASWAASNRDFIEARLLEHGAVLFRDFAIESPTDFEQFAQGICGDLYGEYGDLPREQVGSRIYGATVYPAEQAILFHNESSHLNRWPLKIVFYCAVPAQQGGESPILDCRKIYERLDPEVRERFQRKKLMYVRTFIEGLDVPWEEFFRTSDRAVVEARCREDALECEWLGERGLRIRKLRPAVARHPKTGEMVFFNQIQLHHVSCLERAVRDSLLSAFPEDELPRNVYYGDGTPIEDDLVAELGRLYERTAVTFPWRRGDVLLLDNMLTAHSRNPFVGPRKILVALGQMNSESGAEVSRL